MCSYCRKNLRLPESADWPAFHSVIKDLYPFLSSYESINQIINTVPLHLEQGKFEFLNTGRKGHPEKFIYDRIAKYSSPIFKTSILAKPTIVVYGAASNKFLFSNQNKLVQAQWPDLVNKIFPSSTQTSSKEESKKLRKMLPNFLKPRP
ncbi:hypothetical protein Pint_32441 [Pistacia integerrima]|uniref:Uncharacterized protein n=1 Tax=Pistacia integerrima TaxID=434235 RepID=A0ACC0XRG4_9ROSI|nr:hypothetical protein Pint_32441 [Pistacia integerrima]